MVKALHQFWTWHCYPGWRSWSLFCSEGYSIHGHHEIPDTSCTQHKVPFLHHMIPGEALAKWFQSDYMQLYCTYTYVAATAEVVTVAVVAEAAEAGAGAGAGTGAGTRTGAAVAVVVVVVEVVRVGVEEVVVLHVNNNNNITTARNIICNYIILLRRTKGQFPNFKIQV